MRPPDLVVLGLTVQALALGHGAVRLLFEQGRPRRWYWLPLALVVAYYVIVLFAPPASLDRDAPVTTALWLNAWRYLVQVAGFSLLIEGLLHVAARQREQLQGPPLSTFPADSPTGGPP